MLQDTPPSLHLVSIPGLAVQVTRYLVSAEAAGLPVTLVLNKADLVPPQDIERIVKQVCGLAGRPAGQAAVWAGSWLGAVGSSCRGGRRQQLQEHSCSSS